MPTQKKPKWQQEFEKKAHAEIVKREKNELRFGSRRLRESGLTATAMEQMITGGSSLSTRDLQRAYDQLARNTLIYGSGGGGGEVFYRTVTRRTNIFMEIKLWIKATKDRFWNWTFNIADRIEERYDRSMFHRWMYKLGKFQLRHPFLMFFFRRLVLYVLICLLGTPGWRTALLIVVFFLVELGAFLNKRKIPLFRYRIESRSSVVSGGLEGIDILNNSDRSYSVEIYDEDH